MKLQTPSYFKNFTCIAGRCIDNCCFGGWQIDIDDETIDKYSHITGNFGDKLHTYVDAENRCFKLRNGQCPFLMSDNLCEIYKELGPENMGIVCTQFPRYTEYFGDIKETGIGLACEEAARLILETEYSFKPESTKTDEDAVWGEYDSELGASLFILRDRLSDILCDRSYNTSEKLIIILTAFHTLQIYINNNDYNSISQYCDAFNKDIASGILKTTSYDRLSEDVLNELRKSVWYSYLDLEPINSCWSKLSDSAYNWLYESDNIHLTDINEKKLSAKYDRLINYYMFRYMLKASFDHDILGKAQLIIANILVINDLFFFRCSTTDKEPSEIFMDIIHVFSRQIEYSEDNINELYENFIFDDVFCYESLINILWK